MDFAHRSTHVSSNSYLLDLMHRSGKKLIVFLTSTYMLFIDIKKKIASALIYTFFFIKDS